MPFAEMLCGHEPVRIEFPDSASILSIKPYPPLADPRAAVEEALARPIGTPPLAELARGRDSACVVISDFTRPVPNPIILPPMLAILEEAGVPREKITILIATGMHRPNLDQELIDLVGPEIADNYRVVNHYCQNAEEYRQIGEIDSHPIEINTHYLEADLKILTGLIEPHMYAGFSGGGKAILPGISSFNTMVFMHSFAMIADPGVRNCVLEGNPFHAAVLKVAGLAGVDFLLNVVINKERRTAGVYGGHYDQAHLAGCELVKAHSSTTLAELADLVITSGGGLPLDATFYQVSKGLIAARDILKPGGTILCLAECREGLGSPDFCGIMREGRSVPDFETHYGIPENFVIDQWCSQTIYQAKSRAGEIHIYSPGLKAEDIRAMGMNRVEDPQAAVEELIARHEKVVVVPEGPYLVGMVD